MRKFDISHYDFKIINPDDYAEEVLKMELYSGLIIKNCSLVLRRKIYTLFEINNLCGHTKLINMDLYVYHVGKPKHILVKERYLSGCTKEQIAEEFFSKHDKPILMVIRHLRLSGIDYIDE